MKTKEDRNRAIGALVRARRYKKEMSQPDLGEHIGVSEQMIQKYETGVSSISVETLMVIAKTLKCKPGDLIP